MRKETDPEKLRDMVRSILPSRYRTGPRRSKMQRKRAHRRGVRADVAHANPTADLLRDVNVSDIVQWRRDGDKLNHFMRWCRAITKGMSQQGALDTIRAILPKNLIGDHAYSHWEDSSNTPIASASRIENCGAARSRATPTRRRSASAAP